MGSRLDRVQDWVVLARRANYNSRKLADACHISLRQLERYCKNSLRCAPKDWLNSLRIEEAQRLLAQGLFIKEVAAALGYKQVSHFCRAFKRQTGRRPNESLVRIETNRKMSPFGNKCRD